MHKSCALFIQFESLLSAAAAAAAVALGQRHKHTENRGRGGLSSQRSTFDL